MRLGASRMCMCMWHACAVPYYIVGSSFCGFCCARLLVTEDTRKA